MELCLGGSPTRTVAVSERGHEMAILIRQIWDEECWAYLGTAGLSGALEKGGVAPCELILPVGREQPIEELEKLARRLGTVVLGRALGGAALAAETVIDGVTDLPLYDGPRALLVTTWGGEYAALPGVAAEIPLFELTVLFPSEARVALEVGSSEVFTRFWNEDVAYSDPIREPAALDELPPSSEDENENEESAPARSIDAIWDDIEPWLAQNAPRIHAGLAPGASAEQIGALETAIGAPLPVELRDWFRRHDGAPTLRSYDFLSTQRALATWRGRNEMLDDGTFLDGRAPADDSGEYFEPVWWHRSWLPIAEDGCGNLICVDLAPGPAAVRGQILFWEMQTGPEASRARSINQWFEAFWTDLATGKEVVDEHGFLRPA